MLITNTQGKWPSSSEREVLWRGGGGGGGLPYTSGGHLGHVTITILFPNTKDSYEI